MTGQNFYSFGQLDQHMKNNISTPAILMQLRLSSSKNVIAITCLK